MADIEKVIKALENCKEGGSCDNCEFDIQSSKCIFLLHADVLELLKEQEAMNVDAFVQWCNDSHIMGDATVIGIKYWVGKYKEIKGRSVKLE